MPSSRKTESEPGSCSLGISADRAPTNTCRSEERYKDHLTVGRAWSGRWASPIRGADVGERMAGDGMVYFPSRQPGRQPWSQSPQASAHMR